MDFSLSDSLLPGFTCIAELVFLSVAQELCYFCSSFLMDRLAYTLVRPINVLTPFVTGDTVEVLHVLICVTVLLIPNLVVTSPVLEFLFQLSCSGFPVLETFFQVYCCRCPVLESLFQVPYSRYPVLEFLFQMFD